MNICKKLLFNKEDVLILVYKIMDTVPLGWEKLNILFLVFFNSV